MPLMFVMMLVPSISLMLLQSPTTYLHMSELGLMTLQPTLQYYLGNALGLALIASLFAIPIGGLLFSRSRALKNWQWGVIIGAGAWIFLFGGMAMLQGMFAGLTPGAAVQLPGAPTPASTADRIIFNIGFTGDEFNSKTQAVFSPTSASYCFFNSEGKALSTKTTLYGAGCTTLTADASTTASFKVLPSDVDIFYVNLDTGTAHYPDVAKMLSENTFLTSCKWVPVTSANLNELVCQGSINKILGGGKPQLGVDPAVRQFIKIQGMPDDLALTLSAPADQTSISTTSGTDVFITWEITAQADNEAFAFSHIRLTSNQTAQRVNVIGFQVTAPAGIVSPATNTNYGTQKTFPIVKTSSTTGITDFWQIVPESGAVQADDISQVIYVFRGASDTDSIQIRLHLRASFPSALAAVSVTMSVNVISAGNALQTATTDAVILRAA